MRQLDGALLALRDLQNHHDHPLNSDWQLQVVNLRFS